MTSYDDAKALLEADPAAYIQDKFGQDQKGETIILYSGNGRQLMVLDRATRDRLAQERVIFPRDEMTREGFNLFTARSTGPIAGQALS